MSTSSSHPQADEIDRIARILIDTWAKCEPTHGVTLHPVSYVATFADMARAIVEDLARWKAAFVLDEAMDAQASWVGHEHEISVDPSRIAEPLVRALYLYPHYKTGSRGPAGCIMDVLRRVAPLIADEIVEHDATYAYAKNWPSTEDA